MTTVQEQQAQEMAPRTRLGSVITFRGQTYASVAELEQALTGAVVDAGPTYSVRLTTKGWETAVRLQREGAQ